MNVKLYNCKRVHAVIPLEQNLLCSLLWSRTQFFNDTLAVATQDIANHQYNSFIALCDKLGLRLSKSPGHMSPPATKCVALGLLYDLEANTVSLPADKVSSMLLMLDDFLAATYATDRQLASLVGRLLYAANCIRSGRLLSNRVLAIK